MFKSSRLSFPVLRLPRAERQASGHQQPPKPFQQRWNALRGPETPTSQVLPRSHQLLPRNPLPRSHPPPRAGGWWVSTQKNKENTVTCIEIWKECLCILQKVIECLGYQSGSRQSSTKSSHVPAPLPDASFKHGFRGNPSPVFLAAAHLQTVLFWHHLFHPLWMCNPQSYQEGARKSFASSGLYAYKTQRCKFCIQQPATACTSSL